MKTHPNETPSQSIFSGVIITTAIVCIAIVTGLYSWLHTWQFERLSSQLERRAVTYSTLFQRKID